MSNDTKPVVKSLHQSLKNLGHDLPLNHVYEALARSLGFKNWRTAKAKDANLAEMVKSSLPPLTNPQESPDDLPICPYCQSSNQERKSPGLWDGDPRYQCRDCEKIWDDWKIKHISISKTSEFDSDACADRLLETLDPMGLVGDDILPRQAIVTEFQNQFRYFNQRIWSLKDRWERIKLTPFNEQEAIKSAQERFPSDDKVPFYVISHYRVHMVRACRNQHKQTLMAVLGIKDDSKKDAFKTIPRDWQAKAVKWATRFLKIRKELTAERDKALAELKGPNTPGFFSKVLLERDNHKMKIELHDLRQKVDELHKKHSLSSNQDSTLPEVLRQLIAARDFIQKDTFNIEQMKNINAAIEMAKKKRVSSLPHDTESPDLKKLCTSQETQIRSLEEEVELLRHELDCNQVYTGPWLSDANALSKARGQK